VFSNSRMGAGHKANQVCHSCSD